MFYHFRQNNSGGSFVTDDTVGVGKHVVVEAKNATEANDLFLLIGTEISIYPLTYFYGCSNGRDCSCCGDRWYPVYEAGTKKPTLHGMTIKKYQKEYKDIVYVHYKNGKIVRHKP